MLIAFLGVLLTGCEKELSDTEPSRAADANVMLRLSVFEDLPFDTRSVRPVTEFCSRINVAFFKDGAKVKTAQQKEDDDGKTSQEIRTLLGFGDSDAAAINGL